MPVSLRSVILKDVFISPSNMLPICQSKWDNCVLMKEPLGYDSEDNAYVGLGSGVGCVAPYIGFHGALSRSLVLICMYPCSLFP